MKNYLVYSIMISDKIYIELKKGRERELFMLIGIIVALVVVTFLIWWSDASDGCMSGLFSGILQLIAKLLVLALGIALLSLL